MKKLVLILGAGVFWIWNLLFLLLMYIGLLPHIGVPLVKAAFEGLIPVEFLLALFALLGIPAASTIIGLTERFRGASFRLFSLFYGFEAPLFLLVLLRFFLVRERTLASTFILGTLLLCIAAYAAELFYGYAQHNRRLAWLQLLAHSLMMLVAAHVSAILVFHVAPVAFQFLVGFFRFRWLGYLFELAWHEPSVFGWGLLMLAFFGLTVVLFLGMPAAFISLYFYSGGRLWQRFAAQFGKVPAWIGTIAIMLIWIAGFSLARQQPQTAVFELLSQKPQAMEERQELIVQSETLRKGLLNAYLLQYRYLSTADESNSIRHTFRRVFHLNDGTAQVFQEAYNFLLSPFLYAGHASDDKKAAQLYAEFFDQPIQRSERRAIRHAIRSTYDRDEVKAGLLDIDEEKVWLAQQQITVDPHGDWADVELYEVYENQTSDVQEVFYSFSLPESAVITGIWLGESEDRAQRYEFQVSPRGAAQQVYNAQVRRREDPALLEQVGPRHYRLRAFPIPPKRVSSERDDLPVQRMHLWLTYKAMRRKNIWPLPSLGEKRNVYWTKRTQCNYNGYRLTHPGETWLPEFLDANIPAQPQEHKIAFDNGYTITATPLQPDDHALPQGKRFAVLLDTSYSMNAVRSELEDALIWLQGKLSRDNQVDFYRIDAQDGQSRRIEHADSLIPSELILFGSIQFQDILRQFTRLRGDTEYDAILALTDKGSYELAGNTRDLPVMPAPLWMVHLGGLPQAYDDATLQAIETSGGEISVNAAEVAQRLAATKRLGASVINVVNGYVWRIEPHETNDVIDEADEWSEGVEPLAARQLIIGLSKRLDMNQLANLDTIHALAKTFRIVSPYSSMIVLVNQQQKGALEEAERQADRFEREVEDGKETLSKPANLLHDTSAVPEPGTVALLLIGLVGISFIYHKKR